MAAYVDQPYYGWSHEELPEQNEYQEVSTSQMLDHGSISFGRYACEPISWEKRSVFTFNKHQEELERFKSNGLVAKKKAYFEEYYKKIRAMKALQENQQTEITLDYSDIGSNASQTEEEKVPTAIKLVGKCNDEVEAQCGLTTSDSDLSSNNNIGSQYSDIGSNTSQTEEEKVPIDDSVKFVEKCKEEVESQNGLITSDSDLSGNINTGSQYSDIGIHTSQTEEENVPIENSVKLVEKCKEEVEAQPGLTTSDSHLSCNNFVVDKRQNEIVDTSQENLEVNISVKQLLEVSIEEPEQLDICHLEDKEASRENNSPVPKVEVDVVTKEPKSAKENSNARNVETKSAQETLALRKGARTDRKYKDTKSITKMKEPPAPAKNSAKLESGAKLNTEKSLNAPKTKITRKTDVKTGNGVDSSVKTADKVPKNYKSTNTSRPSSSRATNKRPSTSGERRELLPKTSNLKMPSTVKGKEPINAKNTSKLTAAANIIKSKRTEEKRANEDVKKPAPVKVENRSSLKERDTNVLGSSKIRSSSLPPRDRVRPTGVNEIGSKAKLEVNKCEVTRHESKTTKVGRVDTKTQGTRQASEVKKTTPSQLRGRRPGFGEQSQNSRKNTE